MSAIRIFKDYALLWAMLIGALFYPYLWQLAPLTTYTLFFMLLLSYTKVRPSDLKVSRTHIVMGLMQWVLGILAYLVIEPFDRTIATGVALLILTPTATAASVITGMLGGSVAFVTTFMILSNLAIALIGPVLIGFIHPEMASNYWQTVLQILGQVSALLVLPLVVVWLLRYLIPKAHDRVASFSFLTFWIWVFNIMILIAKAIHTYLTSDYLTLQYTLLLSLITLVVTLGLYYMGGLIATWTGERRVNGRQTFGQKNTVFAIWLALSFLDAEVAFFPTLYIVIQNVINSIELTAYQNSLRKKHNTPHGTTE